MRSTFKRVLLSYLAVPWLFISTINADEHATCIEDLATILFVSQQQRMLKEKEGQESALEQQFEEDYGIEVYAANDDEKISYLWRCFDSFFYSLPQGSRDKIRGARIYATTESFYDENILPVGTYQNELGSITFLRNALEFKTIVHEIAHLLHLMDNSSMNRMNSELFKIVSLEEFGKYSDGKGYGTWKNNRPQQTVFVSPYSNKNIYEFVAETCEYAYVGFFLAKNGAHEKSHILHPETLGQLDKPKFMRVLKVLADHGLIGKDLTDYYSLIFHDQVALKNIVHASSFGSDILKYSFDNNSVTQNMDEMRQQLHKYSYLNYLLLLKELKDFAFIHMFPWKMPQVYVYCKDGRHMRSTYEELLITEYQEQNNVNMSTIVDQARTGDYAGAVGQLSLYSNRIMSLHHSPWWEEKVKVNRQMDELDKYAVLLELEKLVVSEGQDRDVYEKSDSHLPTRICSAYQVMDSEERSDLAVLLNWYLKNHMVKVIQKTNNNTVLDISALQKNEEYVQIYQIANELSQQYPQALPQSNLIEMKSELDKRITLHDAVYKSTLFFEPYPETAETITIYPLLKQYFKQLNIQGK